MRTKTVCVNELQARIGAIENLLASAKERLAEDDLLQCAVRLEMIAEQGKFAPFQMDVFESMSSEKTSMKSNGK